MISSFAERPGFQQLPGAFLYLPIAVDLSHGLHITLGEEVTDAIDTMTGRNLLDQTSLPDLEPHRHHQRHEGLYLSPHVAAGPGLGEHFVGD